jgi:UDP-hydrolysing UDP-N-acetyl-D-glucosamine 2-epimerase
MKKILALTMIRSDYDLMSPLYQLLHEDENIDLRLLVGGAHLSETFGYTVSQIEKDGFTMLNRIESLLDSNSKSSRIKSFSILLQNSIDSIAYFDPDLIIYAGDREDVMLGAMVGGYLEIPTAHFFGGDHVNDGHIDNLIRHAASKLSSTHFVTLQQHKERLVAMGESAERIFVTGNISLDKFVDFVPLEIDNIKKYFHIKTGFDNFAIMIFHPTLQDSAKPEEIFEDILKTLKNRNINTFVSYPNVDPGNFEIRRVIEKYAQDKNFIFYKNLERNIFLSLYKHSSFIVGNSSSGVCEAASIPIPALNVGTRQTGRYAEENVIFVDSCITEIEKGIDKVANKDFQSKIKTMKNPYGDGNSAHKAYEIIKKTDFKKFLLKTEDPLEIKNG